jgi:type IV pilus assembly protein PilA
MLSKLNRRMRTKGEGGFTLIELLVVIIIIAILAAIAIPTFLGQRQKAQDSQARSLVRNAMTAAESAYVDDRDFTAVTNAMLTLIEPAIVWGGTDAGLNEVTYSGLGVEKYQVRTQSRTGTWFGAVVYKGPAVAGETQGAVWEGPGWQ